MKSKEPLKIEDQQFGQWIRAIQFNSSQKSVVEVKGFEVDTSRRSSQIQLSNNLFNSVEVQFGPIQKPVIMTKEVRKDYNLPLSKLVIENQLEVRKNGGQLNMDSVTVNTNSKTEYAVMNFEETLKEIDKELFEDVLFQIQIL